MPNLPVAFRSFLPAVLLILSFASSVHAKSALVSVSGAREPEVSGLGDSIRNEIGKAGWTAINGDAEYAAIFAKKGMLAPTFDRPFPGILPAELKPAWTDGHRACEARTATPRGTGRAQAHAMGAAEDCSKQLNEALHRRWLDLKKPDRVLHISISKRYGATGYDVTVSHFLPQAAEGRKLRVETEPASMVTAVSRAALSLLKGEGTPYDLTASRDLPEAPSATLPELEQTEADLREAHVPLPTSCEGRLPKTLALSPESELSRSLTARYGVSVVKAKATTEGTLTCRVSASKSTASGLLPMETVDVVLDCGKQQFRAGRATMQAKSQPGGLRGVLTETLIKHIVEGHCSTSRAK